MWIALILGVLAVAYVVAVVRTAAMNKDPLQQELAALIMEMMAKGADGPAQNLFAVSVTGRFMRAMVADAGAQQTRLVHALSICRPSLSASGYEVARQIVRRF